MKCSNCNHEQESGKFCGGCGSSLVSDGLTHAGEVSEVPAAEAAHSNNENLEKAKQFSSAYGHYSLKLLKRPSHAFDADDSLFFQGLTTLFVYLLAFSLSLYFLANSYYKQFASFVGGNRCLFFQ
ncbi:hypothetical protein MUN89_06450 [Halobacillus salinarum]|uniref:Zinc ribbon domain-containing protein n=1 Tax=Halobacillus salinarum TaxID=2932257 RepID=A0ABY4EM98_9BACI|nr:hypothetical protein [Halobacillus salinarum]UOQ45578.1 hypothetical protein MUN89_06450 [Halobacillus salinarum]